VPLDTTRLVMSWVSSSFPLSLDCYPKSITLLTLICISLYYQTGHNMGAHHDRATVTSACDGSGYNFGYRGETSAYRSILAYSCRNTQCDNNPYTSCTRLPFFSNPNLTFGGKDMGNAGTDNARKINENAQGIANLLATVSSSSPTTPVVSHNRCNSLDFLS
jgi:hypothetical protein